MPTRRRIILCLVLCVTGIVGCGGGGGSSTPVPPVTNPISGVGSVLDQGKAASLFDSIDSRGEAWLGLVDSDSGFFHLTGEDPETNEILEKIPDLDPDSAVEYDLSGHWTCAGCRENLSVINGALSGRLLVDGTAETARLYLGDDRIDLNADLNFGKTPRLMPSHQPNCSLMTKISPLFGPKYWAGYLGLMLKKQGFYLA